MVSDGGIFILYNWLMIKIVGNSEDSLFVAFAHDKVLLRQVGD